MAAATAAGSETSRRRSIGPRLGEHRERPDLVLARLGIRQGVRLGHAGECSRDYVGLAAALRARRSYTR